jgi:FG-GAP-like repeat
MYHEDATRGNLPGRNDPFSNPATKPLSGTAVFPNKVFRVSFFAGSKTRERRGPQAFEQFRPPNEAGSPLLKITFFSAPRLQSAPRLPQKNGTFVAQNCTFLAVAARLLKGRSNDLAGRTSNAKLPRLFVVPQLAREFSMKRFPLLALVLALSFAAPQAVFAFSALDMQPHYDRYLVYTTEPLAIVFDASLDVGTVGSDALAVTDLATAAPLAGLVTLETTTLANDTLVFTPTGRLPFARRLLATVHADVEDIGGGGFDGLLPTDGIFVANMPNNLDPPDVNDPLSAAAAFYGFNPADPENTNPDEYWKITGMSLTEAWKMETGRPDVLIAVIDVGAQDFTDEKFRDNVFLNRGELTQPTAGGTPCPDWDCNGDSRFNANDYADDPTVNDANSNGALETEDLLILFEDGQDNDGNGFVDDIAGWDFFRDVNTPYGVEEFPEGTHGDGIGRDAAAQADIGVGDTPGTCPNCSLMFLRVADAVVGNHNTMAAAVDYAAAMGADTIAIANGAYNYSGRAAQSFVDAVEAGVFIAAASGDELGFHHIFPAAGEDVYSLKAVLPLPPLELFGSIDLSIIAFTESYCTNYGPAINTSVSSDQCTSTATGYTSGLAGLLKSWGRNNGLELSPVEIKMLLNMTADDIKDHCFSFNLNGCKEGFDENFGYGRVNMKRAMQAIGDPDLGLPQLIPPAVRFTEPLWWETIDPTKTPTFDVVGTIDARGRAFNYTVEIGLGQEPNEADYDVVASGSANGSTAGVLGTVSPLEIVNTGWLRRTPTNANSFTVTVRVQAWYDDGHGNAVLGEARKVMGWHTDDEQGTGLLPGFPMKLDESGDSSPVLYDMDGAEDGRLEIVFGTSYPSIEMFKYDADAGQYIEAPGFPVVLPMERLWEDSVMASTAIGPLFGDGVPYIVAATWYGKIYVIHPDGNNHAGGPFVEGFPVSAAPRDNSTPLSFGHGNAFLASPVLADLDLDGMLEIVAACSDQMLYAWKPVDEDDDGFADTPAGWPVPLDSTDEAGLVPPNKRCEASGPAQVLGTPVAGILDPDHDDPDISGHPSIIVATTETCNEGLLPTSRVYAVYWDGLENSRGPFLPGWPAAPAAPLGDALPIPPLTVGMTASPAAIRFEGQLMVGIGAFLWLPQMVYWDGEDTVVKHLRSRVNLGASAAGTFARFDASGIPWYFFPTAGVLQSDRGVDALLDFNIIGWRLDDDGGRPPFRLKLDDINLFFNPTVADLNNDGLFELVAGSGGYLVHAVNATGAEPADWPKFTMGWQTSSPAIADLDGDGLVEVVSITHEGNLFAWKTRGTACVADELNGDWPKFHHDPFNSGLFGNDAIPPRMVTDLTVYKTDDADVFEIHFTAPGDDFACGTAASYDLRFTTDSGVDLRDAAEWQLAATLAVTDLQVGGTEVVVTVTAPGAVSFAMRAFDDQNFVSPISPTAAPENAPVGDDDDDDDDDTTPTGDDDDTTPDSDDDDDDATGDDDDDDTGGCGC